MKKIELKTRNKRNNFDYKIVNITILLIFLIGLAYVVFTNESLNCYYKENFNVLCKTCGITRDFKSILRLDFSNLINPISINFFVAFFLIFTSRFISLFMLFKNVTIRKVLTFDIIIAIVSRDSNGNGVVAVVDEIVGETPFPTGSLSVALGGSFLGSCFIQKEPFYTAQNVAVLQEKIPLSVHTKLFISSLVRNECKIKYLAFGRELNSHFRKDFTIKLPILKNEKGIVLDDLKAYSEEGYIPDWKYMENFMKSLPYGDRL